MSEIELLKIIFKDSIDILEPLNKIDKEIERLKEELEYTIPIVEHNKTITKHLKEIERLNNIIKEVREYATGDLRLYDNESIEFEISNKLLEILKGSDKE